MITYWTEMRELIENLIGCEYLMRGSVAELVEQCNAADAEDQANDPVLVEAERDITAAIGMMDDGRAKQMASRGLSLLRRAIEMDFAETGIHDLKALLMPNKASLEGRHAELRKMSAAMAAMETRGRRAQEGEAAA